VTRRDELAEGACDYVLERGLIGLSLRPLAAALGTSDRMLLYHFGTREALIAEVLRRSSVRWRRSRLCPSKPTWPPGCRRCGRRTGRERWIVASGSTPRRLRKGCLVTTSLLVRWRTPMRPGWRLWLPTWAGAGPLHLSQSAVPASWMRRSWACTSTSSSSRSRTYRPSLTTSQWPLRHSAHRGSSNRSSPQDATRPSASRPARARSRCATSGHCAARPARPSGASASRSAASSFPRHCRSVPLHA